MLRAEDVARYFLVNQNTESGVLISNLKIQKLCYYAQGFALAILKRPLFMEDIERWPHGPVVPPLWRKYHSYRSDPIPIPEEPLDLNLYDMATINLLNRVNQLYGSYSALELRAKTHAEPPWIKTPDQRPMTHPVLRDYFVSIAPVFEEARESERNTLRSLAENPQVMKDLKRGVDAFKSGRMVAWNEVKEELGI